jgi:hypothetical protein
MKTVQLSIALAIASLSLISCKEEDRNVNSTNGYLPLETGNYWHFNDLGKIEVNGIKTMNGKTYYFVRQDNDTSYYRIESDHIWVMDQGNDESVKFDLSANVNDTWKFNSYTVKFVSKADTVIINSQKIPNCYQFYFDIPATEDAGYSIWLAPGIGFIQKHCGFCVSKVQKLSKAKINGQNIDF